MSMIWLIGVALMVGAVLMPTRTHKQDSQAFGTAILGIAIVIASIIMGTAR